MGMMGRVSRRRNGEGNDLKPFFRVVDSIQVVCFLRFVDTVSISI
jgi:hypothetical protein